MKNQLISLQEFDSAYFHDLILINDLIDKIPTVIWKEEGVYDKAYDQFKFYKGRVKSFKLEYNKPIDAYIIYFADYFDEGITDKKAKRENKNHVKVAFQFLKLVNDFINDFEIIPSGIDICLYSGLEKKGSLIAVIKHGCIVDNEEITIKEEFYESFKFDEFIKNKSYNHYKNYEIHKIKNLTIVDIKHKSKTFFDDIKLLKNELTLCISIIKEVLDVSSKFSDDLNQFKQDIFQEFIKVQTNQHIYKRHFDQLSQEHHQLIIKEVKVESSNIISEISWLKTMFDQLNIGIIKIRDTNKPEQKFIANPCYPYKQGLQKDMGKQNIKIFKKFIIIDLVVNYVNKIDNSVVVSDNKYFRWPNVFLKLICFLILCSFIFILKEVYYPSSINNPFLSIFLAMLIVRLSIFSIKRMLQIQALVTKILIGEPKMIIYG